MTNPHYRARAEELCELSRGLSDTEITELADLVAATQNGGPFSEEEWLCLRDWYTTLRQTYYAQIRVRQTLSGRL